MGRGRSTIRHGVPLIVSDHDPDLTALLTGQDWARIFPAGDFVHAMNAAMRRYVVPFLESMVRDGSVLIDAGFVDADGLTKTVDAEFLKGPHGEMDRTLFQIASTEMGLRGLSGEGE